MEQSDTLHEGIECYRILICVCDLVGFVLWCLTPLSTIFQSVLLVEEIGIAGENYRPAASH
jgi:hypothetical protein